MKEEYVKLKLPEGEFETKVMVFEEQDKKMLFKIYKNWRELCEDCANLKSRTINIPEALSEGAFCIATGNVRVTGSINRAKASFDCYDTKEKARIQVKASSVEEDLTSFGPKSVWDRIYFLDFYRKGNWDGKFDIYLLKNEDVETQKVNKNQTFTDQQKLGRRPRFSIQKEIIKVKNMKPIKTGDLSSY